MICFTSNLSVIVQKIILFLPAILGEKIHSIEIAILIMVATDEGQLDLLFLCFTVYISIWQLHTLLLEESSCFLLQHSKWKANV